MPIPENWRRVEKPVVGRVYARGQGDNPVALVRVNKVHEYGFDYTVVTHWPGVVDRKKLSNRNYIACVLNHINWLAEKIQPSVYNQLLKEQK